jgi:hypothetical protein
MSWLFFMVLSLAPIPLAAEMARERNRSARKWLWIAVAVGPFAPLALAILGDARNGHPTPAN